MTFQFSLINFLGSILVANLFFDSLSGISGNGGILHHRSLSKCLHLCLFKPRSCPLAAKIGDWGALGLEIQIVAL
jgi:hypothetical protein